MSNKGKNYVNEYLKTESLNDILISTVGNEKGKPLENDLSVRNRHLQSVEHCFIDGRFRNEQRQKLEKIEFEKLEKVRLEKLEKLEFERLEKLEKEAFQKRTRPNNFYVSPL